MKSTRTRNGLLASLALGALAAYVLACASFSPDDNQVLYPAFEPRTGASALNVYDRRARTATQVFVLPGANAPHDGPALRPQWSADGRYMIAAWPEREDREQLNLLLMPAKAGVPTRYLRIAGMPEAAEKLVGPLAIQGPFLYSLVSSNLIQRLDLATGETRTNAYRGELGLYPSPRGDRIWYAGNGCTESNVVEIGTVEPETLTLKRTTILPSGRLKDGGLIGFARDGRGIALIEGEGDDVQLLVWQGTEWKAHPLKPSADERVRFGFPAWSADGRTLVASYTSSRTGMANATCEFGLAEIPVDGGTPRRTRLFSSTSGGGDETDSLVFPAGLSNDGKTVAIASTYVAANNRSRLKPEDLALYLVDLSSPKRTVTRVPIPAPKGMFE